VIGVKSGEAAFAASYSQTKHRHILPLRPEGQQTGKVKCVLSLPFVFIHFANTVQYQVLFFF
jgi:hypothetical protein